MKKVSCIAILLMFGLLSLLQAQHAIGSWQSYLSYHSPTLIQPAGNIIYVVGNGGLYAYDKEDESLRTYWKDEPLSDTNITNMAYQKSSKILVIIYSNANIDLLVDGETAYNLPDYKDKNMVQDKTVNAITFEGDNAYLATSFGIIAVNLKKREISNTYNLNKKVNKCVVLDDKIYAATPDGLLRAMRSDNLLDNNSWKRVSEYPYIDLAIYNGDLIGSIAGDGVQLISQEDFSNKRLIYGTYTYVKPQGDMMFVGNYDVMAIFNSNYDYRYIEPGIGISDVNYENGIYWMARNSRGMAGYKFKESDNAFELVVGNAIPDSPIRNLFYDMSICNGKLLVAGGGINADSYWRRGTVMTMENNSWTNFQEDLEQYTNISYHDVTTVIEDPTDSKRHYATCSGQGLYEFYDGKFVQLYTPENSTLQSAITGNNEYVRTNGLIYDNKGNLYVVNTGTDVINNLHVVTPDKKWIPLFYREINDKTNLSRTIFDRRGNLWVISTWQLDNGVFCVNFNGTPENNSDDKSKFVSSFYNQDGTALTHKGIFCIAEDQDGAIWLGTGQGPIVLSNPSRFFEDNYNCIQIKVPRNDGTNLADFLLANDQINAIAIDGGNRKWVGTESNGIYLLSPDGMETIHHFTEDNSPLPSSSITSIAIDHTSGKVYIGTVKGLVSYQSDATEGESSFKEDRVYAYPNPVHPGYTGLITVTGLMRDSDVKITNISGKLIYQGTSLGGQFSWDGRNMQGNRVASGIYFVMAADAEGKEGIVTKIMVVK